MLPIIHLFIHLTSNQKTEPAFVGTVRLALLEKRLKMRINDSRNKKLFYLKGYFGCQYTQPLSSQVQVQHTNANSN